MTDPNQPENQQETLPVTQHGHDEQKTPQSGSGRGLAFLSLVVSLAIVGGGIFVLNKITTHYNDAIAKLNLNLNDTAPKWTSWNNKSPNLTSKPKTLTAPSTPL